jgi:hypothetical protein
MAFVKFAELQNSEFANLPMAMEFSNAQRKAWHCEMKSRLFKHSHSFTKTMVVIDLTNGPVEELTEGYKPTRADVAFVLGKAAKLALAPHRKMVVKAPSSSSPEACEARDTFMASMGFSWNQKGQRYERAL